MNTAAGILQKDLQPILSDIKRELLDIAGPAARLIVFGSYARGEQRADSDVDLMAVLPDSAYDLPTKDRIRDAIYEYSLKTPFLFSVIIVSESIMEDMRGFKVFASVDREGVAV